MVLVVLLSLMWSRAYSQSVQYQYKVVFQNKKDSNQPIEGNPVRYGHYVDYNEAQRIYQDLKKKKEDFSTNWNDVYNDYSLESSANGSFDFYGLKGMGVIIITKDSEILLIKHTDALGKSTGLTDNDTKYDYTVKKENDNAYSYHVMIRTDQQLDEAITIKELKGGGNRSRAFAYPDGYEHFEYHLEFPAGYHEETSRIILLPYVVDCLTEDTIDYLPPVVYEGSQYHALQDKRKDYDYHSVDPLGKKRLIIKHHIQRDSIQHQVTEERAERDANGRTIVIGEDSEGNPIFKMRTITYMQLDSIIYKEWSDTTDAQGYYGTIEDLPHKNGRILIDQTIDYKKPDIKKTYRGVLKMSMEDYHHQYYEDENPGTCLRISPFKFLQMSTAAVDIPLTDEFYENAAESPIEKSEDLNIQFVHSKAEVIEDSLYIEQISKLEREMHDVLTSGGRLQKAEIVAYASPDGSDDINSKLASNRAVAAQRRIHVPGGTHVGTRAVIDTWENTAAKLETAHHLDEAQVIRQALENTSSKKAAEQEIRRCPTYAEVIKPVLESQCRVEFKYSFFTKKVMNSKEAVEAYFSDKRRAYSNGDYYNMFAELIARKDSAELDTLTQIAYDRIIKSGNNVSRRLAPYVINRMAVMCIRQGTPNTSILEPLLYEKSSKFQLNYIKTDPSGILDNIKCNRPEMVLNQAIMYFQLQEPERASWYLEQLKKNGWTSDELTKLNYYINFQKLYQIPEDQRKPEEKVAFNAALAFVENSSPDNRAVLYTEFEGLNKQSVAMEYVLQMKDSNPVKWYLMALLWAKRDGKEKDYPIEQYMGKLGPDSRNVVDASLDITDYPYYMGYFQKSFDLDASFARHYFNEGYIDEQMRKKKLHAYKINRIPVYKKIYALRQVADVEEKEKLEGLRKTIEHNDAQTINQTDTNKQDAEEHESDENHND